MSGARGRSPSARRRAGEALAADRHELGSVAEANYGRDGHRCG